MNPLVGAAAIGGGSAILGGLLGSSSAAGQAKAMRYVADQSLLAQRETNTANREIAQMNNDFNLSMLDRQEKYNLEQWERQTKYDSAKQQVARFREAGLNPYLMMSSGASAGSAASAMGLNTPTADQSGKQMPIDYSASIAAAQASGNAGLALAQGFKDAGMAISQGMATDAQISQSKANAKKTMEEARGLHIQNAYQERLMQATLDKMINETNLSKSQKALLRSQLQLNEQQFDFNESTWNDRMNEIRARNELAASTKIGLQLDNAIKRKQMKYIEPQARAQLAFLAAQAAQAYAAAGLSKQLAKESVAKTLKIQRDTLTEEQANAMAEIAVNTAKRNYVYDSEFNDGISQFFRQGANTLRHLPSLPIGFFFGK